MSHASLPQLLLEEVFFFENKYLMLFRKWKTNLSSLVQKSAELKKLLIYFYCWFQGNMRILVFSIKELSASAVKEYIFNNSNLNLRNRIFRNMKKMWQISLQFKSYQVLDLPSEDSLKISKPCRIFCRTTILSSDFLYQELDININE